MGEIRTHDTMVAILGRERALVNPATEAPRWREEVVDQSGYDEYWVAISNAISANIELGTDLQYAAAAFTDLG